MSRLYSRREFLRHALTLSVAGAAASACAGQPQPTPTTVPPTVPPPTVVPPTAIPPTATQLPATAIPATATALPTVTPVPPTAIPPTATKAPASAAYLAVARGKGADPAELTRRALAAIGGIERFVKRGAEVVVKPNICTAYYGPEYAATTNPDVVAAIVRLALGAGAKRVRVLDFPFGGTAQASYTKSGIAEAVKAAGGEMEVMSQMKFRSVPIPQGKAIKTWSIYGGVLDADVVINVPIAKDHSGARLTLGMKNLMGVIEDRSGFHARGLHQTIADLSTVVKPQLTVIDAVRMLMDNGPTGGNLNDVKRADTIIASHDVVAADAYATTLFGLQPKEIGYIRMGAEHGLGQMDLKAIKVDEFTV